MIEDLELLVEKAKSAFQNQTLREGQSIEKDAKAAVAKAKKANNRQSGDGASIQEGDVIIFPINSTQLEDRLLVQKFSDNQEDPSIGVLCPVLRKGRLIMQRIFPGLFNRANEEFDETTGKGNGNFIYPGGAPAEDFRAFYGSMYDVWESYIGKAVRVKSRKAIDIYGLKRGAVMSEDRTFAEDQRQKRTARVSTFEYVPLTDVESELGFSLTKAPATGVKAGEKGGEKK